MSEDFDIRDEAEGTTDKDLERVLRPKSFEDFTGQRQVLENLQIFVQAAKLRGESLDHVLLHGPPKFPNQFGGQWRKAFCRVPPASSGSNRIVAIWYQTPTTGDVVPSLISKLPPFTVANEILPVELFLHTL